MAWFDEVRAFYKYMKKKKPFSNLFLLQVFRFGWKSRDTDPFMFRMNLGHFTQVSDNGNNGDDDDDDLVANLEDDDDDEEWRPAKILKTASVGFGSGFFLLELIMIAMVLTCDEL